jgi:hypothetical protein
VIRRFLRSSLSRVPRSLTVGALLVVSALPAAAQETDPCFRLDANSKFAVEAILDSAKNLGLPWMPLRSQVCEGIAKTKGDGRRIVTAVRDHFTRLKVAQATLGPVGDDELEAAATVLRFAKPAQVAAFRERQKGRSDLEAFTVWTDLINRGVPGEDAFAAINKLWRDGADDATFRSLWKDVQADISQGLNPGAALQNRVREAPGRAPNKPTQPEGEKENQSSR